MARPTDVLLSIFLAIGRGVVVVAMFVAGIVLIYGFGAGYFGYVAVPTPFNVVVSVLLLALLVAGLRKFELATAR